MKITLEIPEAVSGELLREAMLDGHHNRSAVVRKAISFYLSRKSQKVNRKQSPSK